MAKLRYLIKKDLVYISGRHGHGKDVTVHVVQDGPLCGGHQAQPQVGRVQKEVDDQCNVRHCGGEPEKANSSGHTYTILQEL